MHSATGKVQTRTRCTPSKAAAEVINGGPPHAPTMQAGQDSWMGFVYAACRDFVEIFVFDLVRCSSKQVP